VKPAKLISVAALLCLCATALRAQESDSISARPAAAALVESFPARRITAGQVAGIAVPAAMVGYGVISQWDNGIRRLDYDLRDQIARRDAFWHIHAEDYVMFAPAAAAGVLKLSGVQSASGWIDMAVQYTLSNALAGGIVTVTKHSVGRLRPDGSNRLSFPSGHTETAFVAAEFLHQEYKDKSVWISVAGYGAAAFVGAARIMNDRHWLSDVVAGAGVGILSTKAVYWVYPCLKKAVWPGGATRRSGGGGESAGSGGNAKKSSFMVLPGYSNGILSLNVACVF